LDKVIQISVLKTVVSSTVFEKQLFRPKSFCGPT